MLKILKFAEVLKKKIITIYLSSGLSIWYMTRQWIDTKVSILYRIYSADLATEDVTTTATSADDIVIIAKQRTNVLTVSGGQYNAWCTLPGQKLSRLTLLIFT